MDIKTIIYCSLFFIVGIITLLIGLRFLLTKKFFSYHIEATWLEWNKIENPLQIVILAIMKMAGFGILCLSIFIIALSILRFNNQVNTFLEYFVPIISLLFWSGSFGVTFSVYKKTNANTPWKGSLFSMSLIIIAVVTSIL